MAEVQIRRQTACGHDCSDCAGCTQVITGDNIVTARNELNAKAGDVVLLESATSKILAAASMVYILPFVLFFVGYFLAGALMVTPQGALPVACGLVGFFLGILCAIGWDRLEKRNRSLQFEIVEIKKRCLDT